MKRREMLRADPFESQALYLFDFAAWLESEITRRPLQDIIWDNLNKSSKD